MATERKRDRRRASAELRRYALDAAERELDAEATDSALLADTLDAEYRAEASERVARLRLEYARDREREED